MPVMLTAPVNVDRSNNSLALTMQTNVRRGQWAWWRPAAPGHDQPLAFLLHCGH